jgi:hypothetical protein
LPEGPIGNAGHWRSDHPVWNVELTNLHDIDGASGAKKGIILSQTNGDKGDES